MISASERCKIAVVGLGYVGLSIASVLARRGARVFGIDRREDVVAKINAGICPIREPFMDDLVRRVVDFEKLSAHTDPSVAGEAGVIMLCVGTPLDQNYRPDTGQLRSALEDISPYLAGGKAVILKSTVPPGTTRKSAEYLAAKTGLMPGQDFSMACCPERLAEGRMIKDVETIPVVVGGLIPDNTREISAFWRGMGWETITVSGPEEAEMSKLADNLWIDINIAIANELSMVCHRMGLDVLEVISAANTLPKGSGRVNILLPGPGVGGSCLVKDPWFLHYLGEEHGLTLNLPAAGRKINDSMPGHIVKILGEGLKKAGVGMDRARITVLGLSFKQNTGDTRFSPSIQLIRLLWEAGAVVRAYDPWVEPNHAMEITTGMAAVETDMRQAVLGCHAAVFMVGHPEFLQEAGRWKEILPAGCLVMDCRHIFDPVEMRGAGISYLAPGRRISR
ncbi:MAG: nucleotide sugar dehydrogenase [Bacillota bacterium]